MSPGPSKRRSQAVEFAATVLDGVDLAPASPEKTTTPAPSAAHGTPERYAILGTLGEGGMGRVLEATDLWFGRRVALKEILTEAAPPALIQRFMIEALVTGNLEHPGIVAVHERGVREGRPYYVMRKLPGRTLADALAETRSLRERLQLVPMLVRVAETISFAHERGVIHRDLKPDNIVLGTHGEVTVIDWGIARIRELDRLGLEGEPMPWLTDETKKAGTVAGSVIGTPAYMAPEQAAGAADAIDERTDVFALGALLYHVLSGRAPFDGVTEMQLVKAITVDCPPVLSLEKGAPAPLVAICTRAMAKDASERFASAKELAVALQSALTDALTARASPYLRAVSAAVSVVTMMGAIVVAVFVYRVIPTFREMGFLGYSVLLSALIGALCGIVELVAKERYRLANLTLAFATLTLLSGLLATMAGLLQTLRGLGTPEIAADAEKWRALGTQGMFESLGGAVTGVGLASVILVLWIVARLRRLRPAD